MPYKYCNYTSSCEPFNKLCINKLNWFIFERMKVVSFLNQ
jgi:hypothetical protein